MQTQPAFVARGKYGLVALSWLAVVGWYSMIFAMSGQAGSASGQLSRKVTHFGAQLLVPSFSQRSPGLQEAFLAEWEFVVRKGAHATEYAALTTLLIFAVRISWQHLRWLQIWLIAVVAAWMFALSDEFHQRFIPGRVGTIIDTFIDGSGALVGGSVAVAILRLVCRGRARKLGCEEIVGSSRLGVEDLSEERA